LIFSIAYCPLVNLIHIDSVHIYPTPSRATGLLEIAKTITKRKSSSHDAQRIFPSPELRASPPPSGPLKLRHVLDDPKDPRYPLNKEDVQPTAASETYTHTVSGLSATRSQLNEAGFRLWAKLTELVPVSVDASTNRKSDSFTIKTVDTIYFLPSKTYLEASLKSADVK
jgi:hypothetical protein